MTRPKPKVRQKVGKKYVLSHFWFLKQMRHTSCHTFVTLLVLEKVRFVTLLVFEQVRFVTLLVLAVSHFCHTFGLGKSGRGTRRTSCVRLRVSYFVSHFCHTFGFGNNTFCHTFGF